MRAVFLDYETVSYSDLGTASLMRVMPTLRLYDNTADSQLIERIEHAEVVLLSKIKLARAALEAAPQLRLIAVAGTGTDHIDLACAEERAIGVCNVRGYCTQSVAWAARESRQRCLDEMAANVQDFLSGGRRGRVV